MFSLDSASVLVFFVDTETDWNHWIVDTLYRVKLGQSNHRIFILFERLVRKVKKETERESKGNRARFG
jgi:hypothetical protein